MDCQTVQAELVATLYGELDRDTRSQVTAHLDDCSACRGEMDHLRRLLAAITPAATFPQEHEVDWDLPVTCLAVRADLSSFLRSAESPAKDDNLLDHMDRCTACSGEAAAVDATLDAVRGAFPGENHVDWDAFARETAQQARAASLADETAASQDDSLSVTPGKVIRGPWNARLRRAMPVAAAIVAALGLGYLAARLTPPENATPPVNIATLPAIPAPLPEVTAPDGVTPATLMAGELLRRTRLEMARADTAAYLDESHTLLASFTGLPVPCDGEKIDVSVESQVSSRLLRRKHLLDRDLDDVEIARARRLADEVGALLEEIAILQKCASPRQVEEIRKMMEQRQMMMRIKMLTDELQQDEPSRSEPVRGDRA
jgi:anti-sigma factor RsiW